MTTLVCHTLKLRCETNSKSVMIMKKYCNGIVTFVVKKYLGGMIFLFSKAVDHQVCYPEHAGKLYDEHKLNAEMLCLKCNSTITNSLEQLYRHCMVSVCFIADILVIGISVNLFISVLLVINYDLVFIVGKMCWRNILNVLTFVKHMRMLTTQFVSD